MDFAAYVKQSGAKLSDLAADMGCDPSFASHVKLGNKPLPMSMAIRLYQKRGVKIGPLTTASPRDIEVLARYNGEAAA